MDKKIILTILIIVILLTAGFFRLYNISYTEFKVDQALNMYLTLDIIKNGPMPEHILMSSVGTYNPPLFHYLLVLPVLVSKSPIVASGLIAFLNILAILSAFFFLKSIFNQRIAWISCMLWAVNPWAIMYSKNIWHQNVLPIFIILFFGSILKLILDNNLHKENITIESQKKTNNSGYIVWASLSLACLIQLHISTFCLVPLLLGVVIWQRKKIKFLHLSVGVLIFLIILMPYFIYEIQHDFYNLNKFIEIGQQESSLHWESFWLPFKLASTMGLEIYLGKQTFVQNSLVWLNKILSWLLIVSAIAGIALVARKITANLIRWKKKSLAEKNRKYMILILWLILPVVFLLFSKSDVYDHYYILVYPVVFIFVALFFDHTINYLSYRRSTLSLIIKKILYVFMIALIVWPVVYSFDFIRLTKTKRCVLGIYSKPYHYQEEEVREMINNKETDLGNIYTKVCNCGYCFPVQIQYIYEYLMGKLY